jgi:hypothetical protein
VPAEKKTGDSENARPAFAGTLIRGIGQGVFALFSLAGLVLCLGSAVAAGILFSQGAFRVGFGNKEALEFFVKLYECGAVFLAAAAGAALLLFGLACRRWPRMLLGIGITAALIGAAPLPVQLLLWAAAVLMYSIRGH